MGIKLIVEFMDHGPSTLTAAEWKAMVVLLEDANDQSRLTWSSVTDPKIVSRIGLSQAAWTNLRGVLVRKGALEVAVPGRRGKVAKYRVPVFTPMGHGIDEETEKGHGIDEESTAMPHETHDESAQRVMGFMTPTPPSPLQSLSSAPGATEPDPQQPPAAPSDERETIAARPQATPLTAAQRAVRAASVVPEVDEQAFIHWLTANFKPRSPAWWRTAAADFPEHAEAWRTGRSGAATTSGKPVLLLADWCGQCNDGDDTAATDPARRWIHRPDGTSARCHCHPASAATAA